MARLTSVKTHPMPAKTAEDVATHPFKHNGKNPSMGQLLNPKTPALITNHFRRRMVWMGCSSSRFAWMPSIFFGS